MWVSHYFFLAAVQCHSFQTISALASSCHFICASTFEMDIFCSAAEWRRKCRQGRKWISVPISSRAPRLTSQEDFLTQCSTNWCFWRSDRVIHRLWERDTLHLSAERVLIQETVLLEDVFTTAVPGFTGSTSLYIQLCCTLWCSYIRWRVNYISVKPQGLLLGGGFAGSISPIFSFKF